MGKMKVEVKHLGAIEAGTILATLEERSTQIRELEREIATLNETILGRDNAVRAIQEQSDTYRNWWEAERLKTASLMEKIATVDGTADRKERDAYRQRFDAMRVEVERKTAEIAYLRGYIDHTLGNKPQPDPDFREVGERYYGGPEGGTMASDLDYPKYFAADGTRLRS